MKRDELGNRMKRNYEIPWRHYLTRRVPVIVRVDGRAFHTLTASHFKKPFDQKFIDAMHVAATCLAGDAQGFKLGYVQSDEFSFVLTDYDNLQTDGWFGYCQNKIESISAARMTFAFARCLRLAGINANVEFDARAFNIPESEVANYFLWRVRDWHRNSVSMYTRSFYSHRKMEGRGVRQMHEMLHKVGRNWTIDLTDEEKNGTFLFSDRSTRSDVGPRFQEINALWTAVNPTTREEKCGNESDQSHCQMSGPNTLNAPVGNENDSESNTIPSGSRSGTLGNGT
jgi:tRNA(His) guanylyltransferase